MKITLSVIKVGSASIGGHIASSQRLLGIVREHIGAAVLLRALASEVAARSQ